eukprot:Gb_41640 [translate_table: standard]
MRRLFPLKPVSASNSNKNSNNLPTPNADKDGPYFWESMVENGGDNLKENSLEAQMKRDASCPPRNHLAGGGNTNFSSPKADGGSKLGPKFESNLHKRSQSSSSSIFSSGSAERNPSSLSDGSKSSISSADVFVQGIERIPLAATSNGQVEEKGNSSGVNRGTAIYWTKRSTSVPKDHPETNPRTPPNPTLQPLRCNSVHQMKAPNGFLEYCFVGKEKNEDIESLTSGKALPEITTENDGFPSSGRPPRCRPSSQAPVASGKGLTRSQSFSEAKNFYAGFGNIGTKPSVQLQGEHFSSAKGPSSSGSSVTDKFSFRYQNARNVAERLVRSLPGKSKSKANTFDIKKASDKEAIFPSEGRIRRKFLESVSAGGSERGSHRSFCATDESSSKSTGDSSSGSQGPNPEECRNSNEKMWFHNGQTGRDEGPTLYVGQKEVEGDRFQMWLEGFGKIDDTDEELERRAKAAEEQAVLLSKELEAVSRYHYGTMEAVGAKITDLNAGVLQQKLRKVCEEKRNLAFEVSCEIRSRMRERSAANEALQLIKGEMESRGKMIENEKNDLQLSLEKELDRRSSEWANKLEKIKLEEKRLRDRVRDLAEQNVALQREVSSLNNREIDIKQQARESEIYMDGFKTSLEEAKNEIIQLQQSLFDSRKQAKQAEDDRDSIKRGYKEKERENYDLQKSVVRLQRLCKDQERTISGLWQGLNDEISDAQQDKSDHITKLLQEQLRLAGVEQALRKDLENCRCEVDSLRQENTNLLERVRNRENVSSYGLIKLDQELRARLDGLQSQALSLLDENIVLSAKLLEFINDRMYTTDAPGANEREYSESGVCNEQAKNYVLELEMNFHRLGRKVNSLKKSVRVQNGILKEKAHLTCNEALREDAEYTEAWQPELEPSEAREQFSELQQELKAETLLAKVLREKLCSREIDLERLQEEVATLIRSQDVLRSENVSLQEMLRSANHKEKDMELQLGAKDDNIHRLHADLQECLKELVYLRGELPKVSKERDASRQQTEQLGRENMRLSAEVETLTRRLEKLDEDVLVKEGELSILQETLNACKKQQLGRENVRLSAEVETLKRQVEKLDEVVVVKQEELSILQETLNACKKQVL